MPQLPKVSTASLRHLGGRSVLRVGLLALLAMLVPLGSTAVRGENLTRAEDLAKPSAGHWSEFYFLTGRASLTKPLDLPKPALPVWTQGRADNAEQIRCLALNIYFEARSEPELGKRAVAHVVINRVLNPRFPNSVCDVVQQGGEIKRHRCQFSWWCDGLSDRPQNVKVWRTALSLAHTIYWGYSQDPTRGALWYHADYVSPVWGKKLKRGPQIGRHIFYTKPTPGTQVANRSRG